MAIRGDVDLNGQVTESDKLAISDHIIGVSILTGEGLDNADVNDDLIVDVADTIIVASFLASPPQLISTLPRNGEAGVAVTRETILQFSAPLDPASVNAGSIFAELGPEILDARYQLSPDGSMVTLFYDQPLPGSARIRINIMGANLLSANAVATDPDNDGVPGGTAVIEFDTLSLTSIFGTSVTGRVFASELAMGGMGNPVNVPLAGVRITSGRSRERAVRPDRCDG